MKLRRKRLVVATGGVVAAVAVLVLAIMAGQHYINPDRIASPTSDDESSSEETTESDGTSGGGGPSTDGPSEETPEDLAEFTSDEGGFAISYPKRWERIETPPDSPAKLVVTADEKNSLKVSTINLGFSVGSEELAGMREYTSRIVDSGEDVDVVAGPSRVELDGVPGHVYIYTFTDPETGETGVHSHYFLFDGDRMFTLVFQALPEERYEELAPLFDTIADSFRTQ